MSLLLHNSSGIQVTVSEPNWFFILVFAEHYGWVPAGTVAPRNLDPNIIWDGQYDMNAGQSITAEDAEHLAKALEGALSDPARRAREKAVCRQLSKTLSAGTDTTVEYPDMMETISAVARLSQCGSFTIGNDNRNE